MLRISSCVRGGVELVWGFLIHGPMCVRDFFFSYSESMWRDDGCRNDCVVFKKKCVIFFGEGLGFENAKFWMN